MANFELDIETEEFASCGVKLRFDETAYGGLLDLLVGDDTNYTPPIVNLRPNTLERRTQDPVALKALRKMVGLVGLEQTGHYEAGSNTIHVNCSPSLEVTNRTLRHETKHWGDDVVGNLEIFQQTLKDRVHKTLGGSLVVGYVLMLGLNQVDVNLLLPGVLWGGGTYFGVLERFINHPAETSAREFELDPEVVQQYGHIISYEQII